MATVRLSDAIIPAVYLSYTAVDSPEKTAVVQSGAMVTSPQLNEQANNASQMFTIPFWKDIDPNLEPNYSNDDPADLATPNKIGSGQQMVRKAWLNQAFSAMDLTQELAGSNPMQHIRNRFGTYWTRQLQRRMIASLQGIFAANVAKNAGDMVKDVSVQTTTTAAANMFSRDAFVDAAFTLGDNASAVRAIVVHSMVHRRMVKNDDIDMIPDSQGNLTIPTYMGKLVIVDDGMPMIPGTTSGTRYLTALLGGAAFLFGSGNPPVPAEVEREAAAGNGGGMEVLWERREWLIHANGFSWNEAGAPADAITEFSPALADLRKPNHWDRVLDRKQVPLAFLITNG